MKKVDEMSILDVIQANRYDKITAYKFIGEYCELTDFSVLLGSKINDEIEEKKINQNIGPYWIKCEKLVKDFLDNTYIRKNGIRLAIKIDSLDMVPRNEGSNIVEKVKGFYEVEYGYYPQNIVSEATQKLLDKAYKKCILRKTGNVYTTDKITIDDNENGFTEDVHEEYEYRGKRYIFFKVNKNNIVNKCVLSNGRACFGDEIVWIEIKPVEWIVDEEAKIMFTKKIICSGIQYNCKNKLKIRLLNFKNSNIQRFITKILSKELIQIKEKEDTEYLDSLGKIVVNGILEFQNITTAYNEYLKVKNDRVREK